MKNVNTRNKKLLKKRGEIMIKIIAKEIEWQIIIIKKENELNKEWLKVVIIFYVIVL